MLKPNHLREHLTAANPFLRTNPDRMQVFADTGRVVATGAYSLSFEYQYTLNIIVTDFSGHSDAIIVPLLDWLRLHQPELMTNPDRRQNGVRFDVEFLNQQTIDLSIELDLTERVIVQRDDHGKLNAEHVGEPPDPSLPLQPEAFELWADGQPIASWQVRPVI